jgi:hypothetical protein
MVEHAAVNRDVEGSSPSSGAISNCLGSNEWCEKWQATVSETVSKAARKPSFATFRQNFAETRPLRANASCPDWFILQNQHMKSRYILFRRRWFAEDSRRVLGEQFHWREKPEVSATTGAPGREEIF